MEYANNGERWTESEMWDYWMGTVEARFQDVYANVNKFNACLTKEAGVEPIVLADVDAKIAIALKQYT